MQEDEPSSFHGPDFDDRLEKVDGFLFLSLGFTSKQNAWAGPDHWKYQKTKGQVPYQNQYVCLHKRTSSVIVNILHDLFSRFRGQYSCRTTINS